MKQENFNLNISTLDDKVLYREICKKIKDTDSISFKLLVLVPIVSVTSLMIFWSSLDDLPDFTLLLAGLFGALVTYFIFRWEKRNRQISKVFKQYACIMEARKMEQEDGSEPSNEKFNGPYSLLANDGKPSLLKDKNSDRGWGKSESENAVYITTMVLWLIMPLLRFI